MDIEDGRKWALAAAKRGANGQGRDLLDRCQAARDKLSDGGRRLVDGILEDPDETVFLTSPELTAGSIPIRIGSSGRRET